MAVFEPAHLPDAEKETLCRSLLAEFGVTSVSVREPDGELIHRCCLPWHDDSKPSAALNYKKLTYRCLGCDSGGGLLWFIGTCRGGTGTEARAWLADQTGQGPDGYDLNALLDLLDSIYAEKPYKAEPIPRMSEQALLPWQGIHPYLTDAEPPCRGIPIDNVRALRMGYAERYPIDDQGNVSERIVIPHFWKGSLTGWQTRRLNERDGSPKYKSSAEFPKDQTIYNYDAVLGSRKVVVVESMLSVAKHLHHLPIVATFGAAITDRQVRLLAQFPKVILWMDNDDAGWKAVEGRWDDRGNKVSDGLVERLSPYSEVYVVDSPWAADAGDMDDAMAVGLIDIAVPGVLWSKPTALVCWACRQPHSGQCATSAA